MNMNLPFMIKGPLSSGIGFDLRHWWVKSHQFWSKPPILVSEILGHLRAVLKLRTALIVSMKVFLVHLDRFKGIKVPLNALFICILFSP